jgi:hypothetical protein
MITALDEKFQLYNYGSPMVTGAISIKGSRHPPVPADLDIDLDTKDI